MEQAVQIKNKTENVWLKTHTLSPPTSCLLLVKITGGEGCFLGLNNEHYDLFIGSLDITRCLGPRDVPHGFSTFKELTVYGGHTGSKK